MRSLASILSSPQGPTPVVGPLSGPLAFSRSFSFTSFLLSLLPNPNPNPPDPDAEFRPSSTPATAAACTCFAFCASGPYDGGLLSAAVLADGTPSFGGNAGGDGPDMTGVAGPTLVDPDPNEFDEFEVEVGDVGDSNRVDCVDCVCCSIGGECELLADDRGESGALDMAEGGGVFGRLAGTWRWRFVWAVIDLFLGR
ncbi:hypothetical protein B0H34DRAFT_153685 [Crassisporium funariophilum]|nr:hypothetical protein B0H34DRAFT_153685 [Crassisporium funariophilum]